MQEGRGFKGDIGKDKERNRVKKQQARTAKEKRSDKLQDLLSSPRKWKFLESAEYQEASKVTAKNVVEEICYGTSSDIDDEITEALDFKVATRINPQLEKTAKEIEEDIFWCNQYGNK